MTKDERQLFNFIEKFKHHIQEHLNFKPTALSNFHHLNDRILDKRDGCLESFKKNIKYMIQDSSPTSVHGYEILDKLMVFVKKGNNMNDFINVVYWIYGG